MFSQPLTWLVHSIDRPQPSTAPCPAGLICLASVPCCMTLILLCAGCRFSDFEQDVWSLYNLEFGDQMGKSTGWQSLDEVYRVSGPSCWGCGILSKLCSKCQDPRLHIQCLYFGILRLSQICSSCMRKSIAQGWKQCMMCKLPLQFKD